METYDDALRRILQIPPLEEQVSGAQCAIQFLFKPSFHPECAICLVERGASSEMTVRVPERSIWSWLEASRGGPSGNPITDWVEPALSVERFETTTPANWYEEIDRLFTESLSKASGFGIDGMNFDLLVWRAGSTRFFSLRAGSIGGSDPRERLARAVLARALELAGWEQSVNGVRNIQRYLRA